MKERVQTPWDVLRGEHFLTQERERLEILTFNSPPREQKNDRVKCSTHLFALFHLVLKHGTEHRRASWVEGKQKAERERGRFVIACNVDAWWSFWYPLTACHRAGGERAGWLTAVTAADALCGKSRLQLQPDRLMTTSQVCLAGI